MKNNILVLLLLVSSFSYSQENKALPGPRILVDGRVSSPSNKGIKVLKDGTIELREMKNTFKDVPSLSMPLPGEPKANYLQTLPNGNMAFALPQDNMPCIVPNENGSVAIPNATGMPTIPYRYKGPGAIPNPAVPIVIQKPDTKSNTKPPKK